MENFCANGREEVLTRRRQGAITRLVGMALALSLAACIWGNVRGPLSSQDSTAIQRGDSEIVLLRFTVEDQNGNPWVHPFAASWANQGQYYSRLAVGGFDTGGKLEARAIRIPSEDAWDAGWIILVLPPGYYYFAMGPAIFNIPGPSESAPRWRIEVPPGAPVVYGGTFHLSGKVQAPTLFGPMSLAEINQAASRIDDESGLAAQIAHRDLPSLPAPITRLAVLHTGPILLDMPPRVPASQ